MYLGKYRNNPLTAPSVAAARYGRSDELADLIDDARKARGWPWEAEHDQRCWSYDAAERREQADRVVRTVEYYQLERQCWHLQDFLLARRSIVVYRLDRDEALADRVANEILWSYVRDQVDGRKPQPIVHGYICPERQAFIAVDRLDVTMPFLMVQRPQQLTPSMLFG